MKKNKVAILGFTAHRKLAPFDDESFEIWGINDLYVYEDIKRWDRWFQIHHPEHYKGSPGRTTVPEMYAEYAKWDCPVYMWQKDDNVPNSVGFPFQDITDKYGGYFNNTISWLIAFAMLEGFKEINKGDRKAECLLPTEMSNLLKEKKIVMKCYSTSEKWLGVTNPEDEEIVRDELKKMAGT